MDILPEHLTIIDFIAAAEGLARWIPLQCSVCNGPIDFAWVGDPHFCRRCVELAPDGVRQRLLRVRDVRGLLGFGDHEGFVPVRVRRALHAAAGATPPVVGHPIEDERLPAEYTFDLYCLHGLSAFAPADLNGNPALAATADTPRLVFEAVPPPRIAETHHARVMREAARLHA